MRRALNTANLALASGIIVTGGLIYSQNKNQLPFVRQLSCKGNNGKEDEEIPPILRKPTGKYDFECQNYQHLSYFDRRKLKVKMRPRETHIKELQDPKNEFDVLVIGGGATGAGVCLDAAARGLKVALIEKGDFCSGSSSRSTKLIHGGVRYLQQAFRFEAGFYEKFKLVIEALAERNYMIHSAPYMNKELLIAVPCENLFKLVYFLMGVIVYHAISMWKYCFSPYTVPLKAPRLAGKNKMKELFPHLSKPCYGVIFSEGQMDDSRVMMQAMLTSTCKGYKGALNPATVANYTSLKKFLKNEEGQIMGAVLYDHLKNKEFTVKCKSVVNATGPASDSIRQMDDPSLKPRMVGSRGVHVVVPKEFTPNDIGFLVPKTKDGRIMFVLPFKGMTLAGTTDHPDDIDKTTVPEDDVKEIVEELENYFSKKVEVKSQWCGIRPLVLNMKTVEGKIDTTPKAPRFGKLGETIEKFLIKLELRSPDLNETKRLTRNHEIEVSDSGMVSIMGGKWTTYRNMAEETVDKLLRVHTTIKPTYARSQTTEFKLLGSYSNKSLEQPRKVDNFIPALTKHLEETYELPEDSAKLLISTYGNQATKVAKIGKDEALNEKLHPDLPYTKAQIVYSARFEFAVKLTDVLSRRLGLSFLDIDKAKEVAPKAAEILGKELKWSKETIQNEIEEFNASLTNMS